MDLTLNSSYLHLMYLFIVDMRVTTCDIQIWEALDLILIPQPMSLLLMPPSPIFFLLFLCPPPPPPNFPISWYSFTDLSSWVCKIILGHLLKMEKVVSHWRPPPLPFLLWQFFIVISGGECRQACGTITLCEVDLSIWFVHGAFKLKVYWGCLHFALLVKTFEKPHVKH